VSQKLNGAALTPLVTPCCGIAVCNSSLASLPRRARTCWSRRAGKNCGRPWRHDASTILTVEALAIRDEAWQAHDRLDVPARLLAEAAREGASRRGNRGVVRKFLS
jgi:hypothetical protein